MQVIGSLIKKATCNGETHHTKIIITEVGTELILVLDFCRTFKLAHIADTCVLRSINSDVDAMHITKESDFDYGNLKKKYIKYSRLGKDTGIPFQT